MQDFRCTNQKHNKKKITSVSMSEKVQNSRFLCLQCQSETQQNQSICDLDEILEHDHYQIYNWPIDEIGRKAKDLLLQYQTPEQQKAEIEAFFKELKEKIIVEIDQAKDVVLDMLQSSLLPLEMKKQQDLKQQKPAQQPKPKDSQQQQGVQTQTQEILTPSMVSLKQLYDEVYDLSKLKVIIKENYKGDIQLLNSKVNEFLNDGSRREKVKQIKQMQDILVKDQLGCFLTQNQDEKKNYITSMINLVDYWQKCFGNINWKWDIAKSDQSKTIQVKQVGLHYKGAGNQQQIVYSNQSFSTGIHGCILIMEEYDLNRGNANGSLQVGLVEDADRDKSNYGLGLRRCLFSAQGVGLQAKGDFTNYLK